MASTAHPDLTRVKITPEMMQQLMQLKTPIRPQVHVEGLQRIKSSVLQRDVDYIEGATTVFELAARVNTIRYRWLNNHFRAMRYNLEPTSGGDVGDVALVIDVEEGISGSFVRFLPTDTATPQLAFGFRNWLGGAFSLLGHLHSTGKSHELGATLCSAAPFFGNSCEYDVSTRKEVHVGSIASEERVQEGKIVVNHYIAPGVSHAFSLMAQRRLLVPHSDVDDVVYNSAGFATSVFGDPTCVATPLVSPVPLSAPLRGDDEAPDDKMSEQPMQRSPNSPVFALTRKASVISQFKYENVVHHRNRLLRLYYSLPVAGVSFDIKNEFAGWFLGGDATFVKSEVVAQTIIPLHDYFILDLSARAGAAVNPDRALAALPKALRALQGATDVAAAEASHGDSLTRSFGRSPSRSPSRASPSRPLSVPPAAVKKGSEWLPYSDRLFLNWRNVRGHDIVGPKVDLGEKRAAASAGGNVMWALSASLNMPFWPMPRNGLAAMHVFANTGNVGMFNTLADLRRGWSDLFRNQSMAVGAGLVITQLPILGPLSNGRLELNVSVPMALQDGKLAFTMPTKQSLRESLRFGLVWSSGVTK